MESENTLTVDAIILGFCAYFFPFNCISKQTCVMRRVIRKPRGLKFRRYTGCLIGLNEYLDSFPGGKMTGKFCMMELNKILFNSMPNNWSSWAYVQVFDCKCINLKKAIDMFEKWR